MLITNNTESIVVKYLSIFLKETFNTSVEVTNRYVNSQFNAFNNYEIIICNGFCQFALTDINNDNNTLNKIDSLKYYVTHFIDDYIAENLQNSEISKFEIKNNLQTKKDSSD